MRKCPGCKTERLLSEFFKDRSRTSGVTSWCKNCWEIYRKSERGKAVQRKHQKTSEHFKQYQKEYIDSGKRKECQARFRKSEKSKLYQKNYLKTEKGKNIVLAMILRHRLNMALNGGFKVGSAVRDLGCSIEFLKHYLENRFEEGMTWDNRGEWHIDHIDPLAKFDLTDREQLLRAVNYTNLQPLWAADNISKGNR